MKSEWDVAILGGGLAGMTLALQLRRVVPHARIVVIERAAYPVREAAHKVGESTVEVTAHYLSNILQLDEHLKNFQLPKLGLRCFFGSGEVALEERLELGANSFLPRRTFQIDRGRFENFLSAKLGEEGITVISSARVLHIILSDDEALHQIQIRVGKETRHLACRWLIDASGRAALLKRILDLDVPSAHQINAAWFRINEKIDLNEWSSTPSWTAENFDRTSRWYSTNHLMGEGYWVWVIPLSSGSTSIGIVADPRFHPLATFNSLTKSLNWLSAYEPRCAQAIVPHFDKVQDFVALKNYSRCARQLFSPARWAITGDAGIFIDPLYSPGGDFIAFSNTFICDLVSRELRGKKVQELSRLYNDLLISFAENTFQLYYNQYELLGNPVAMSLKVIWDFASYWSFFGFVFCHDRLCDISLYGRVREELLQVAQMQAQIQPFLLALHRRTKDHTVPRNFIDLSKIPYLYGLNEALTKPVAEEAFEVMLRENIERLARLGTELVSRVREYFPELDAPLFCQRAVVRGESVLDPVFNVLQLELAKMKVSEKNLAHEARREPEEPRARTLLAER